MKLAARYAQAVRRLQSGVHTVRSRVVRSLLLASGLACQGAPIEARTDRRVYVLGPRDSVGIVRLTMRNRSMRPFYVQTADGRADILVLIRVDKRGGIVVGADAARPEMWSLFFYRKPDPVSKMGVVRLDPESILASTYALRRGEYRTLLHFGDRPESLDEHGVWLDRFSIQ